MKPEAKEMNEMNEMNETFNERYIYVFSFDVFEVKDSKRSKFVGGEFGYVLLEHFLPNGTGPRCY